MIFRNLVILAVALFSCNCNDSNPNPRTKNYSGISITNSDRFGSVYKDSIGTEYAYRYIQVIIANDSTIPFHLKIDLPKESHHSTPDNGKDFRVFLLPAAITGEDESINDFFFSVIKPFLDKELQKPVTLDTVVNPNKECIINIGYLSESNSNLEPHPIVLFSKGHNHYFTSIPDSAISKFALSAKGQLTLLLGLDFYTLGRDSVRRYSVIPCGKITF